jgi:predicted HicB family RNase H-like nuclease
MGVTKSAKQPADPVRLNINLQKELHQRLKVEAAMRGKTMGELIEKWIRMNCPKV